MQALVIAKEGKKSHWKILYLKVTSADSRRIIQLRVTVIEK